MINRGILAVLFIASTFITSCSKKDAHTETTVKITNAEEFTAFVKDYNSGKLHLNDTLIAPLAVTLESDISIIADNISPIGSEEYPFIGSFDGKGHTISCCSIGKSEKADNVGLFGYVKNSEIKNVVVTTEQVVGNCNVGVICGYAYRSNISNCKVSGQVKGLSNVGGIVGGASYGGVSDCDFDGNVEAAYYLAGGIVGMLEFGGVVRCYAGGEVSGKYGIDPISGSHSDDIMISKCSNRVNVNILSRDKCKVKREMASEKLNRLLFQM